LALSCRERPVFAQKRQGGLQLKLAGGETVSVAPEYITREPVGSAEPPEDDPAVVLDDQDLGSDFEDEDPVPQDEQDWGKADSVRHVRGKCRVGAHIYQGGTEVPERARDLLEQELMTVIAVITHPVGH